MSTAIFN